jgi:hypothetical protein
MLIPPASCPVLRDVNQISGLSESLVRTMRRLRRDLGACAACPSGENCPILLDFNRQVQTAILEINEEWDKGCDKASDKGV